MSLLGLLKRRSVMPTVSAEATGHVATPHFLVKIGTPQLEINVRIAGPDVARLDGVRRAAWDSRGSVQIGEVAGAFAWWCVDLPAGTLSILVGEDDETWDIAVTLPVGALDAVISEVAKVGEMP